MAKKIADDIHKRKVQKEYMARVVGEFPKGQVTCEAPIYEFHGLSVLNIQFTAPMYDNHQSKECKTIFERVTFNGETSIVKCTPITGRTHQIRVHLQYLGHPIVNDTLYNNSAFGEHGGKHGLYTDINTVEQRLYTLLESLNNIGENGERHIIKSNEMYYYKLEEMRKRERNSENVYPGRIDLNSRSQCNQDIPKDNEGITEDTFGNGRLPTFDINKWHISRDCTKCRRVFAEPRPENMIIYLHALRYTGPDWSYCTSTPKWAQDNWQEQR